MEAIYSQMSTISAAQNAAWTRIDTLYQELYSYDESDATTAKRVKQLRADIEYTEGQQEALQKKHDELIAELNKLDSARLQKE